jgi:hypothetical protein
MRDENLTWKRWEIPADIMNNCVHFVRLLRSLAQFGYKNVTIKMASNEGVSFFPHKTMLFGVV